MNNETKIFFACCLNSNKVVKLGEFTNYAEAKKAYEHECDSYFNGTNHFLYKGQNPYVMVTESDIVDYLKLRSIETGF